MATNKLSLLLLIDRFDPRQAARRRGLGYPASMQSGDWSVEESFISALLLYTSVRLVGGAD